MKNSTNYLPVCPYKRRFGESVEIVDVRGFSHVRINDFEYEKDDIQCIVLYDYALEIFMILIHINGDYHDCLCVDSSEKVASFMATIERLCYPKLTEKDG